MATTYTFRCAHCGFEVWNRDEAAGITRLRQHHAIAHPGVVPGRVTKRALREYRRPRDSWWRRMWRRRRRTR